MTGSCGGGNNYYKKVSEGWRTVCGDFSTGPLLSHLELVHTVRNLGTCNWTWSAETVWLEE